MPRYSRLNPAPAPRDYILAFKSLQRRPEPLTHRNRPHFPPIHRRRTRASSSSTASSPRRTPTTTASALPRPGSNWWVKYEREKQRLRQTAGPAETSHISVRPRPTPTPACPVARVPRARARRRARRRASVRAALHVCRRFAETGEGSRRSTRRTRRRRDAPGVVPAVVGAASVRRFELRYSSLVSGLVSPSGVVLRAVAVWRLTGGFGVRGSGGGGYAISLMAAMFRVWVARVRAQVAANREEAAVEN